MNKLLLLSGLCSLSLHAQSLEVKDLWFFGEKGVISGSFEPSYFHSSAKVDTVDTYDSDSFALDYEINYSLLNNFKIGLDLSYANTHHEGSSNSSGLGEPTLKVAYRILSQDASPVYLDASIEFSPSLGESKSDDNLRGNTEISALVAVGQNIENFSYKIIPTVIYNTVTHNKISADADARISFILNGESQYTLNDKFALLANLALMFPGDYKTSRTSAKTDYLISVSPGLKYSIIYEMALSLLGRYSYSKGNTTDTTGTTYGTTANSYGASLKLDFGF